MDKKTILVTGASGTVGFEVIKQLSVLEKYNTIAFDLKSKKSIKKLDALKEKIQIVYNDISSPNAFSSLTKIDAVIHLAAIIPPLADDAPALANKVNVEGTKNLIKHLEKHSPDAFFMYSSSISVYGDRIEHPYIQVNDPLKPSLGDKYAETKIEAEEFIKSSALDWTIFRLAAIMGGHKMSKLMFHQPLNTALEIATPQDTARAFVNGIEKQSQLSKNIYNLGGGESCRISYKHFLERSFAIFGLGAMNFPPYSFADKNFHCGFYDDGSHLEDIVHFRHHDLEDYFAMEAEKVSGLQKFVTSIFKTPIKWFLHKKSEPYQAYKENDTERMHHYFNLKTKP